MFTTAFSSISLSVALMMGVFVSFIAFKDLMLPKAD